MVAAELLLQHQQAVKPHTHAMLMEHSLATMKQMTRITVYTVIHSGQGNTMMPVPLQLRMMMIIFMLLTTQMKQPTLKRCMFMFGKI